MAKKKALPLGEVVLFGILGALTFALKFAMAGLPNIEPVSLLMMVFAAVFGLKALYPCYVYVVMEILTFGIGTWNINYLYIWALIVVAARMMRKAEQPLAWALLSGVFGLFFGAFCAPVDLAIGGWSYALSKWISGIPFDVLHGAGNFVLALIMYRPLRKLLEKLYTNMNR